MKRGRPKGFSKDTRSFGPLGDLIRRQRFALGLGLNDVAIACSCSVQFISNIEHGRAPLPWEKSSQLATVLKVPVEELQAANLTIRSDFRSFAGFGPKNKVKKPAALKAMAGMASVVAATVADHELQGLITKYHQAPNSSKKKFIKTALSLLT